MILRPASLEDAAVLLAWRNDAETRAASFSPDPVSHTAHLAWLKASLGNPQRRLWLAVEEGEVGGEVVGTVRADRAGEGWLLSWTIAPEHRGKGCGKRMLAAALADLQGPFLARIKPGNVASIRIAESLGFMRVGEVSDEALSFLRA
ncbi:GNAT family N-acetyltransferase [Uliginosibacterium sediminicola]|uniref:GNAT family N-acetyltransferase n=1 Tax=Uliginosibacterium sediminicola TaxID=2024550 RepID=A0ABU9Z402_9RHOO